MTATRTAMKTPIVGPYRTKQHLYYWSGEGPWPGVTTITRVLDAPALTNWKLNQVAAAAVENAERLIEDREAGKSDAAVKWLTTLSTTAMDRGHRIHVTLESILRREPVEVAAEDEPAIAGARAWLNERKVRPIAVEAYLLHPTLGYGGTLDLIAEIDGAVTLADWKTGKSVAWPNGEVYEDHRLQLAAYGHAEFLAKVGDPERYPMPVIEKYAIVHVTDGGTRMYEADVTEADWVAFRAALCLHNWRKGGKR